MKRRFFFSVFILVSVCLTGIVYGAGFCPVCNSDYTTLPHVCVVVTDLENRLDTLENTVNTLIDALQNQGGSSQDPSTSDVDDLASVADIATGGFASAVTGSYNLLVDTAYECSTCYSYVYGSHTCIPPITIEVNEEIMQNLQSPVTCSACGSDLSVNPYHNCSPPDYTPDCSYCTNGCSSCQRPEETCSLCGETFTSGTSHSCSNYSDYTPSCSYCTGGCSLCAVGSGGSSGSYY